MAAKPVKALAYFRSQTRSVVGLGVLSAVSAQFQTAAVVFVVPLVHALAAGDDQYRGEVGPIQLRSSPGTLAALAAAAIVVAAILDTSIAWMRSKVLARWEFGAREEVIQEFLRADYPTQATERLGTLGMLSGYVNRSSTALGSIVNAVGALLTVLVFVVSAILLDYRAAFLLLGSVALLSLLLRPLMLRTRRYSQAAASTLVEYGQHITETTRMSREVRVFYAAEPQSARLTRMSRRLTDVRQRASFVNSVTSPLYQYLGLLIVVASLVAVRHIESSDVAVFGVIALLLLRSLSSGQQFQNAYQSVVDTMPYVEKLEELRATYTSHATRDGHLVLEDVHELAFEQLGYSYEGVVDALKGVSASFRSSEIVGIVGPSGSGKSTLSQLILRLREPTAGSILVNRTPASEYTLASWYRHVSLVPQDPRLFHATVWENIAFLDPAISRARVVEAAKAANVHDVIESLAHGYDTHIGPAFRDLSGGQIQRIGIARALARGAQVLVLDEPTSALDVHSEAVIQTTLEGLRGHALVLIIAHRLSTLSICDRIVVLRDGAVETIGTLTDVSERSDFFRRALDAGTLEVGGAEPRAVLPLDDA